LHAIRRSPNAVNARSPEELQEDVVKRDGDEKEPAGTPACCTTPGMTQTPPGVLAYKFPARSNLNPVKPVGAAPVLLAANTVCGLLPLTGLLPLSVMRRMFVGVTT